MLCLSYIYSWLTSIIEFNISAPKFIHTISLGEKAKQLKSF